MKPGFSSPRGGTEREAPTGSRERDTKAQDQPDSSREVRARGLGGCYGGRARCPELADCLWRALGTHGRLQLRLQAARGC